MVLKLELPDRKCTRNLFEIRGAYRYSPVIV